MPLKAKKAEKIEKRLKLFMFGPPGSRKTTSAIQFPNAILIDMERGSDQYKKSLDKVGSVVLQTTNPDEVRAEIKTLLVEKHPYKTLIIDPITIFYEATQDKWTRLFEKHTDSKKEGVIALQDFGMRFWGRVKAEYKQMLRMLLQLDMNVILTAHQKDIYGSNMQKVGVGPDSMKGDNYVFDTVFQLKVIDGKCIATTEKQRSEPLDPPKFPAEFEWSYENFLKFYGKDIIEREAKPVEIATPEQVAKIKSLVDLVRVDEETISKWFTKCDVDEWDQMTSEAINKCIAYVEEKLEPAKGAK